MKLFQYAVIFVPTDSEKKNGQKAEIIVKPTDCLAADEASAALLAGRAIPDHYLDRLDQIQVAVRPF